MITCLCDAHIPRTETRLNPTTLRTLDLCAGHAALHDDGYVFVVRETHLEESR